MMGKRILLIIPEMSMGGAQRSLSKLSLALSRHNHQVFLAIFNDKGGVAYPIGGGLISLDVPAGRNTLGKFFAACKRVLRLRSIKKKLAIDVSISFLEGADYVNVLSRRNDKVILSIRGSKVHDENMRNAFYSVRRGYLIPQLYRRADRIVTVNQGIANELLHHYGIAQDKIVSIGNFYNLGEIARQAIEPRTALVDALYRKQVLVVAGRFSPEKGLEQLLHVFSGLRAVNDDVRLVLVGDGPDYDRLIETCGKLGLPVQEVVDHVSSDVFIIRNPANVFKYLRGATLYLMNSSSEGFPNGLVEAMACKVPVVAADCPYGPREVMAPEFPFDRPVHEPFFSKNGVLMPLIKQPGDIDMWVVTLQNLLQDRDRLSAFAESAHMRILNFQEDPVVNQWNEIIYSSPTIQR